MRKSGTATSFTTPRRKTPSARMWVTILLCLVLPPVGLILLWRAVRCPVRGKILISALAMVSMTFMLVLYIGRNVQDAALIPDPMANPVYGQSDIYASPAPAAPDAQAGADSPDAGQGQIEGGVVPANPLG